MSDFHYHPNLDKLATVHSYRERLMTALSTLRDASSSLLGAAFGSRPTGDALALAFAGLAALNGVSTIFGLLSGRYGDFAKEGGLPFYLFHVCGYVAIGYGITAYFASSKGSGGEGSAHDAYPPEAAVAYGALPLLLFQIRALLSGYFDRLGRGRQWPMIVETSALAGLLTLMLTSGPVDPILPAQIMSIGMTMRALSWCAAPGKMEKIIYNVDVPKKGREATRAVGIELGQNMLTYASLTGALSFGVMPLHAIGLSSLVHAVLLFYNSTFSRTFTDAKASPVPGRIYLAVSVFFAWAFFLTIPFKSHNVIQSVSMPL